MPNKLPEEKIVAVNNITGRRGEIKVRLLDDKIIISFLMGELGVRDLSRLENENVET